MGYFQQAPFRFGFRLHEGDLGEQATASSIFIIFKPNLSNLSSVCVCVCVSPTGLNNRSPKAQATCGSGRHYLEATRTRAGVVTNQNKYLKLGLISLLPSDGPANMQGRMALVLALPSSHVSGRHTASELTQSPFNPLSTATYQSLYKHYHWFHVILMASQQPFAG